jgi:hypothetical protein
MDVWSESTSTTKLEGCFVSPVATATGSTNSATTNERRGSERSLREQSEDVARLVSGLRSMRWGEGETLDDGRTVQTASLRCSSVYEYDEYGNWQSRHETSKFGGHETTHTHVRQLTYYL